MPRRLRYLHGKSDSDEFETLALKEAEQENRENRPLGDESESDDDFDEKSESGLGDSPEEMIEENADSDAPDETDSDDAPDDVGFTSSWEAEKKRMQSLLQQIRKGREETKEKRRKRDELFRMQKQDKLAALSKRKLPTDVLEAVAGKPAKQKKTTRNKKKGERKDSDHNDTEPLDASKRAESSTAAVSDEDVTGSEEDGQDVLGDFVPLSDSAEGEDVAVVALNTEKRKAGPVSNNVVDFRQKMLYSGRINRVSTQQLRATQAKRKVIRTS